VAAIHEPRPVYDRVLAVCSSKRHRWASILCPIVSRTVIQAWRVFTLRLCKAGEAPSLKHLQLNRAVQRGRTAPMKHQDDELAMVGRGQPN
jgi:hypothetical protein